jgi:7-carboxy-7-deazaguanine synthase (Cx14CxxC type)
MTYAVKEIYYTLQGEGANSGRAAVFLRFSGCNLWTGLEKDRHKGMGGCSMWCDTDFVGTNGERGGKYGTAAELAATVNSLWPKISTHNKERPLVVCTGGEPLLQLDTPLITSLSEHGFDVAVETNGTIAPPSGPLWITVSPKANTQLKITSGDELKLVFPQQGLDPDQFSGLDFQHFFLQPLDNSDRLNNTRATVRYCLDNPKWRIGLQIHKHLSIA